MSERDWKLLAFRRSCNLLTRDEMEGGRVPTTPTIASIIAGVQVQETLKLLHGMPTLAGRGFVFAGDSADSYTIDYQRKPDCQSHDTLEAIVELDARSDDLTLAALLDTARAELGADAVLDLGRDVARQIVCKQCGRTDDVFKSLSALRTSDAVCPACGNTHREVVTFNTVRDGEKFLGLTISGAGLPKFDIITARTKERAMGFELRGDAAEVLGPCVTSDEGLEWT